MSGRTSTAITDMERGRRAYEHIYDSPPWETLHVSTQGRWAAAVAAALDGENTDREPRWCVVHESPEKGEYGLCEYHAYSTVPVALCRFENGRQATS